MLIPNIRDSMTIALGMRAKDKPDRTKSPERGTSEDLKG
jgi:hypothetical protein